MSLRTCIVTGPGKPAGTASGTIILSAPGMPMLTGPGMPMPPRDAHADRPRVPTLTGPGIYLAHEDVT